MPTVTTLKSSRTREKKALVREKTEAETLLQTEWTDSQQEMLKLSLSTGKVLLSLETKLARLETANDKLAEALEQEENTEALEQFQTTLDEESELIEDTIGKITQLKIMKEEIEKRRKDLEGLENQDLVQRVTRVQEQMDRLQSAQPPTSLSTIWTHSTGEAPIKAPQLDIPVFNGEVLKWQEFWDTFEATIHKGRYSSVDKMNYLKSKLTGEALDAISGYQLSNDNYKVVVDVLQKRFGNPQSIIDAHYRSLSHLPVATNHVTKLRQCYDGIECHLRSLEALGENTEHRHFVALITEKLPQKVLYQLYMMKGEEAWTVKKLRELLGKHITAMELAGGESHPISAHFPVNKPVYKPTYQSRDSRNPRTVAELLTGGNSNQGNGRKPQNVKCVFCGQDHWSDECPKYTTQRARMEKLKGSCFRCLQKGHLAKDCQKQKNCFHCGKNNHHRSLCSKLFTITESTPTEPGLQTVNIQDNLEESTSEGANIACGNQVLMQTATTTVGRNPENQSISVRIILDSGSQRTYITEKLAENLKLELKPPERLSVATFGSDKPKQIKYRDTVLQLTLKDGSLMCIEASVVPHITGKISRVPLNTEDLTFLKNEGWESKLADTLPTDSEHSPIEMLIGNDYYFELLLPRKMELGEGLYLFQSKLGWILGGRYTSTGNSTEIPSLLVSTLGTAPTEMKASTHMLSKVDSPLLDKPDLNSFWNLESIGIVDSPLTSDDDRALEMFNSTVKFDSGRYLVSWPWKESPQLLPDNYQLAVGCLKSTLNQLKGIHIY